MKKQHAAPEIPPVHPEILALCRQVTSLRPRRVIDHIINHGSVTTEQLKSIYGYDHPPRAIRDVREQGIPLVTERIIGDSGRRIGIYRFGDPANIKNGRIGGRQAFSKAFKNKLIEKYGEVDQITSQKVEGRYLQIDHRIPYEIAGDQAQKDQNPEAFMLLDASSQRAKSWSCEKCPNLLGTRDPTVCKTCYWAAPESYSHIATIQDRRADIRWVAEETADYDALQLEARNRKISTPSLIKEKLRK